MHLIHHNLTIRNATAADAPQLALWWNDGAVMAHAGFPHGLGITPEKIISQLAADGDASHRRLLIEIDGLPAGEMSYRIQDSVAEIGIKLCDASRQNKGDGKRLLSMLISALFCDLHCCKIVLDTNLNNLRAQHVYEQLGFRRLRVNTDSWTDQLGRLQSSVDYELLPEDFHSFIE